MPKINAEIKEQIKNLSKKQLEDIVIKFASNKEIFDFLLLNFFDKENGENDLYDMAIADIDKLKYKRFKGFSEELKLANFIKACSKRINNFSKISKNKKLEADLLLYVLEIPFSYSTNFFGTCFTTYDTQVAIQIRKLIKIVTTQLHEDLLIEYRDKINSYLEIIHRTSNFLDTVNNLPEYI